LLEPEYKANYGRKKLKFEEEARSIKDVFQWDDREQLNKKKEKL